MLELNSISDAKNCSDVRGGWVDPVLVLKARAEEMQYVKNHAGEPGKNPIKAEWLDTSKGKSECQEMRSRCVAKK